MVCDVNAISIGTGTHIDRELCTRCGACAEACVSNALKKIGKTLSVDEVVNEIMKDEAYYGTSGGGVTFSGGEPSLHADFILEILKECKKHSIHTNIETNGYFNWGKFKQLLPYLDQVFFDLKIIDPERNRQLLGGDSDRILANMDLLLEYGAPVEFRVPLIPQHTSDEGNLQAVIALLRGKGVGRIHLLPYHSMGEGKAERICSNLPKLDLKPLDTEQLRSLQDMFEKEEIEIELYR